MENLSVIYRSGDLHRYRVAKRFVCHPGEPLPVKEDAVIVHGRDGAEWNTLIGVGIAPPYEFAERVAYVPMNDEVLVDRPAVLHQYGWWDQWDRSRAPSKVYKPFMPERRPALEWLDVNAGEYETDPDRALVHWDGVAPLRRILRACDVSRLVVMCDEHRMVPRKKLITARYRFIVGKPWWAIGAWVGWAAKCGAVWCCGVTEASAPYEYWWARYAGVSPERIGGCDLLGELKHRPSLAADQPLPWDS